MQLLKEEIKKCTPSFLETTSKESSARRVDPQVTIQPAPMNLEGRAAETAKDVQKETLIEAPVAPVHKSPSVFYRLTGKDGRSKT